MVFQLCGITKRPGPNTKTYCYSQDMPCIVSDHRKRYRDDVSIGQQRVSPQIRLRNSPNLVEQFYTALSILVSCDYLSFYFDYRFSFQIRGTVHVRGGIRADWFTRGHVSSKGHVEQSETVLPT